MMFSFDSEIEDISPKILKPKQVLLRIQVTVTLDAGVTEGNYYVYGLGQLLGVYDPGRVCSCESKWIPE